MRAREFNWIKIKERLSRKRLLRKLSKVCKDSSVYRPHVALAEGTSSFLSTSILCLTTTCFYSTRGSHASGLHGYRHWPAHISFTCPTYILLKITKINLLKLIPITVKHQVESFAGMENRRHFPSSGCSDVVPFTFQLQILRGERPVCFPMADW